jgi:mannose-6-phosphate isomerase-like protein (cupin superfamily)
MTRRLFPILAFSGAAFAQKPPSPVKTDERKAPRDYSTPPPAVKVEPAILADSDSPWQQVEPGLRRKVWFNDRLTMVLLEFTRIPGKADAPQHYHAHDQMSFVLEGRVRALVDGKTREIGPGGVFIAPSNVRHGIQMVSDKLVLLDVFTPTRDDFRG